MGYELQAGESLASGLQRILYEQLDQAIESLENLGDEAHVGIHEARKSFKKMRAVLRLLRDGLKPGVFKRENRCYRDAGRALAGFRDGYVRVLTVEALMECYAQMLDDGALVQTRRRLLEAHQVNVRRLLHEEDRPAQVTATLKKARQRLEALPWDGVDAGIVRQGLHRVYKRGYRARMDAYVHPRAENFHEWRKRVKYLYYQSTVLHPLWPGPYEGWPQDLDDLGEHLGHVNDLAHLRAHVLAFPAVCPTHAERKLLLALGDRRRIELQALAYPLGRRIYAQTPEAFVMRPDG